MSSVPLSLLSLKPIFCPSKPLPFQILLSVTWIVTSLQMHLSASTRGSEISLCKFIPLVDAQISLPSFPHLAMIWMVHMHPRWFWIR
jgi:hypothetical protein